MQEASQHLPNIYHKKWWFWQLDANTTFPRTIFWPVQLFVCCESQNVPWAVLSGWGVEQMLIVGGQWDIWNSNVFHCRGWLHPNEVSSLQQMETEVTYLIFDRVLVSRQAVFFSSSSRFHFMLFSGISGYRCLQNKRGFQNAHHGATPIPQPQCWK